MTDPSALSTENIVATIVTGIGLGLVGLWNYFRTRKEPTAQNGDRIVPGLSIADMRPFGDIATSVAAMVREQARTSDALEAVRDLLRERAEDHEKEQEIVRRAELLAQQMIQGLRAGDPSPREITKAPRPRRR
jgi:hypothetical protein